MRKCTLEFIDVSLIKIIYANVHGLTIFCCPFSICEPERLRPEPTLRSADFGEVIGRAYNL